MQLHHIVALWVLLALAGNAHGSEKKHWRRISGAAVCAAQFFDAWSSRGLKEGNPFLAGANGKMNWGVAIPVKAGLCGVSLWLAESRVPAKLTLPLNFGMAGVTGAVAARNFSLQRRDPVKPAVPLAH